MAISEFGSANVTMADICRAAGLSKGGLAHYYKSKRELFKAVFEEFFKRIFVRCRDKMAEFDDPLEKLLSLELLYDADDQDAVIGYPILFEPAAGRDRPSSSGSAIARYSDCNVHIQLGQPLQQSANCGAVRPFPCLEQAHAVGVAPLLSGCLDGRGKNSFFVEEVRQAG